MPDDPRPFGPDTLIVPAFLVDDPNDPAFLRWLRDHPDAFPAGTWRRASSPPATAAPPPRGS